MKRIKNKIKAVIFDMDGTILKTGHLWNKATEKTLRLRGFLTFSDEQKKVLDSLSGAGLAKSSEIIKKAFNLEDPIEVLANEIQDTAHKLLANGVEFIDGFEQFHQKLQKILIPTSIASNAGQTCMNLLKDTMKLERFFGKNLYCVDMVNKAKPHPEIFLLAAKKLNIKPEECVVFEDSIVGFQAAKTAGMKCIAIKNSINQKNLDMVDLAIDSYHEAEEALIKLLSPSP